MRTSSCSLFLLKLRAALLNAVAATAAVEDFSLHRELQVVHSSCSAAGDCSARLQAAFSECMSTIQGASSQLCEVQLVPPGAVFRLEQSGAVTVSDNRGGIALRGNGARLELHGDAPFLVVDCNTSGGGRGVSLSNFTLVATRPAFTYGVVSVAVPGSYFNMSVDFSVYPMDLPWTKRVDTIHQVSPETLEPSLNGLDWIYQGKLLEELELQVDAHTSTVSFADHAAARRNQPFRSFGLQVGNGVVLRHMLEFSRPKFDSIVLLSCNNVTVSDVTIHSSPGMGILAHDCTNVVVRRVHNEREFSHFPLAGNADAIHIASCRGEVVVEDCVCDRQGDDGLNIHSQLAIVQQVEQTLQAGSFRLRVGPNANADNTSWGCVFARPVFRVGDTVAVRSPRSGLSVIFTGVVENVADSTNAMLLTVGSLRDSDGNQIQMSVQATVVETAELVSVGDLVIPLSAMPSKVIVAGNVFSNSRASGIILQTNNALVSDNHISNVSSGGISSGNYFNSFSESPFGSLLTLRNNHIFHAGLGHRTAFGGMWGQGSGGISITGSPRAPNTTALHRNLTILDNRVTSLTGNPPLSAHSVFGLKIERNSWCSWSQPNKVSACADVINSANLCCDNDCHRCRPC